MHLEIENGLPRDPIGRLAVLGGQDMQHQLRLSNQQTKNYEALRACMSNNMPPHELGYRYGEHIALLSIALRAALFENPINNPDLESAKRGGAAQFPLSGQDLKECFQGTKLGRTLKDCEGHWITSEFRLGKQDLLRLIK